MRSQTHRITHSYTLADSPTFTYHMSATYPTPTPSGTFLLSPTARLTHSKTFSNTKHKAPEAENAFALFLDDFAMSDDNPAVATAVYASVPVVMLFGAQCVYYVLSAYVFRASTSVVVHNEADNMDWLSLVTQHTYVSAIVPCHYRCVLIHGLQLAVHLFLMILVILMLLTSLNPSTESVTFEAVIVLVSVLVPQALRPLCTWVFYHFTPDQEILAEGLFGRQRHATTTAKDFYEGNGKYGRNGAYGEEQPNGGVSAAALEVLDNIVFDENEMGSQYTDYEDDQLPYDQYDSRWNPEQDIQDTDELGPGHVNASFGDDGERSAAQSDYNEDLAFVGLYRPAEGTPRQRGLIGGGKNKAPVLNRSRDPYADDGDFIEQEDTVAFMYGHLASEDVYDEDLDPFQDHDANEALHRMRSLRTAVEPPNASGCDPRYIPDPQVRPQDLEDDDETPGDVDHRRADRLEMTQGRSGARGGGPRGDSRGDRHAQPATRNPQREDRLARTVDQQVTPLEESLHARRVPSTHQLPPQRQTQMHQRSSMDSMPENSEDFDRVDARQFSRSSNGDADSQSGQEVTRYDPKTGTWVAQGGAKAAMEYTSGEDDRFTLDAASAMQSRGMTPFEDASSTGAVGPNNQSQHIDDVFEYDEPTGTSQFDEAQPTDGDEDPEPLLKHTMSSLHPLVPKLRLDLAKKPAATPRDDQQQSYSGKPAPEQGWYDGDSAAGKGASGAEDYEYYSGDGDAPNDYNDENDDDGYSAGGGMQAGEGEPLWVPIHTWHRPGLVALFLVLIVFMVGDFVLLKQLSSLHGAAANMFAKLLGMSVFVDLVFIQQIYLGFILIHRYLMSDEYDEHQKSYLHPFNGEYREF